MKNKDNNSSDIDNNLIKRPDFNIFNKDKLTIIDLLSVVGGVRGIFEASIPTVIFVFAYVLSNNITISAVFAFLSVIIFAIIRFFKKLTFLPIFASLFGIIVSIFSSNTTGNAIDYYLPGIWINIVYFLLLVISSIFRIPIFGFLFSFFYKIKNWRSDNDLLRNANFFTFFWSSLFLIRALFQIFIYYLNNVAMLGTVKLLLGIPLYVLWIFITWLLLKKKNLWKTHLSFEKEDKETA